MSKMNVATLKLLLSVALISTVATVDHNTDIGNARNCSLISGYLPINKVQPIKYDIELTVMPEIKIIKGISNITLDVKQQINVINLYSYKFEVARRHIKLTEIIESFEGEEKGKVYELWDFQYCEKAQILILLFYEDINPGKYILHLEFKRLVNVRFGINYYPYFTSNNVTRWLITNLYKRNATRGLFPCWDDPKVKASFNITIRHPYNYAAYLNKPVWKVVNEGDNIRRTHFHVISSMPIYLLSIAVIYIGDTMIKPEQVGANFIWDISKETTGLKFASNSIASLTSTYSDMAKLNLTDLLEKVDHIALSDNPTRSMAQSGVIIYSKENITYNNTFDFSGREIEVASLIATELARQLFVGVASKFRYFDMWLNEILALFCSKYVMNQIWKDWRIMDLFVVHSMQYVLNHDFDLKVRPIVGDSNNVDGIDKLFYSLLYYNKGVALIRMLFHIITPKNFLLGIRRYLHTSDMIWTAMQYYYHPKNNEFNTIKEIMDTWLKEEYYPIVYVERDFDNNAAICYVSSVTFNTKWKIPITYATQSTNESQETLNVTWINWQQGITIPNIKRTDLLIVNLQQIGYYRVNYDDIGWRRISDYLEFDDFTRIPVLNRAQLISDAYYFASKGELESAVFLDIAKYLKQETDYVAWCAMFNIFSHMSNYKYFKFPESKFIKTHFVDILDGLLKNIGFEDKTDDDPMRISLRLLALNWACIFGHRECRAKATAKVLVHLKNKQPIVKQGGISSLQNKWLFCAGIMSLDFENWQMIYYNDHHPEYRLFIIYLTCSEVKSIIEYYLKLVNYASNEDPIWQDVYRHIIKKHANKDDVLTQFFQNYKELKSKFSMHDKEMLGNVILNVYSIEYLDEIKSFADESDSVDRCSLCIVRHLMDWKKKHIMKIKRTFNFF